jgi:hypothetical protein
LLAIIHTHSSTVSTISRKNLTAYKVAGCEQLQLLHQLVVSGLHVVDDAGARFYLRAEGVDLGGQVLGGYE